MQQDDLEDGSEVRVNEGKTLPEDRQFRYEQAQLDAEKGFISPADYLQIAGYQNASQKAKNAVAFKLNPPKAVGMSEQELQEFAPPQGPEEKPPAVSINYRDLPPDAQLQVLGKVGVEADPNILFGEKLRDQKQQQEKDRLEAERTMSTEKEDETEDE